MKNYLFRMRILQIAPKIPFPPDDGGKISIFGLLKYLSKRGHEIDYVAYRRHSNLKSVESELDKYCNPFILDVQADNNIFEAFVNLFSNIPYNISKYITAEMRNFLNDFLPGKKYDLVHITNLHMGWTIDIIRKYLNIPIVLRQENLEMMIMKRFSENQTNFLIKKYSNMQLKKFLKYEPSLCEKFDKCIMISNKDEKTLLDMNPKIKTTVIPAGVDEQLFDSKKNSIIPYSLVHIGHTDWFPNYDGLNWFLNDVFPEIIKKYPNTKLYIYGGGNTKNFPVSKTLKGNVTVEGFVEDIWKEIEDKALAIVPLRIGGGIRIKIIEMLAVGQPIITTSIGKEGLDVEDKKHLLIADTKDEFVNKISDFFGGKFNNDKMIENGKEFIRANFIWDNIAKKFEHLYQEIIDMN